MTADRRTSIPMADRGIALVLALLTILAAGAVFAAARAQAAAPAWRLTLITAPTNPQPEGREDPKGPAYLLRAINVGAAATTGTVTASVTLPAGIVSFEEGESVKDDSGLPIGTCSRTGQRSVCTILGAVPSGGSAVVGGFFSTQGLPESFTGIISGAVSGGGAQPASVSRPLRLSDVPPSFDLLSGPEGFAASAADEDGAAASQAGAHPFSFNVDLGLPSRSPGHEELPVGAGSLRDARVTLPRGVVVNPKATLRCTEAQLEQGQYGCPSYTQVGTISAVINANQTVFDTVALYNMVPPPGAAAEFGFWIANTYGHISGGVRPAGFRLYSNSNDLPAVIGLFGAHVNLWGQPSSSAFDAIRSTCMTKPGGGSCPVSRSDTPLLTMPSACSESIEAEASVDSWEEPGIFHSRSAPFTDAFENPAPVAGCGSLDFSPTVEVQPTSKAADSPTGLDFNLHVPQNEAMESLAEANLRDARVVLPEGVSVNPSSANGLDACSEAQIGLSSSAPQTCPNAAKVGTLEVKTQLLDHSLPGSIYVAQPYHNPFGTLLAIYLAIEDPESGIVIKLPGEVRADQRTGQLTATFKENPELPFEEFKLRFFGGAGAALKTPLTCGTRSVSSTFTPWSAPEAPDARISTAFETNVAAAGGSCPTSESQAPLSAGFSAGTVTPLAGAYSPFVLKLSRPDGAQNMTSIETKLPPGLLAKLAGVGSCSESQIAQAQARSNPGDGTLEQHDPSCPQSSEVGTVTVGAGAGPRPYYTTGHAYLAGPYKGAPVSMVIVTPAVAGPYDLGTVVTRVALHIDPVTAEATAKSDPVPTILDGIPLDVRSIALRLDRSSFTLNPTSCEPMSINGSLLSVLNQSMPLSSRFQVGGCRGLDFAPKLKLKLKGKTRRGANPALTAVLTQRPGQANIKEAAVALPHSEFLDQAHIKTVCTRVQFAAKACPRGSIYGHAEAITPLLDEPLTGPIYMRSSSHKLPDLVLALRGPDSRPIEVVADGRIDSHKGGIRNTFELVPDAPISRVVLRFQGGRRGLLQNSVNLCAGKHKASTRFVGHNGKVFKNSVPVRALRCSRHRHRKHARHHRRAKKNQR